MTFCDKKAYIGNSRTRTVWTKYNAKGATNVFCGGLRHIQENLKEYKVSVFVCVP